MSLYAQESALKFERFSTANGLSSNIVTAIFQDSKGYLWIGTHSGLNRFDGNKFRVFQFNPRDSNSLLCNTIYGIAEDPAGDLWISTQEGLCRFNRMHEKFYRVRISSQPEQRTSDLYWIGNDELLVHCFERIIIYNIKNGKDRELTPIPLPAPINTLNRISRDRKGNFYFGGTNNRSNKIFRFNQNQRTVDPIRNISTMGRKAHTIRSYYVDSHDYHWFGGEKAGELYRYLAHISPPDFESLDPIAKNIITVNSFYEDAAGRVWISTGTSLFCFDYSTNQLREIKYREEKDKTEITNAVLEDRTGVIWVGGYDGLYKRNPESTRFTHIDINNQPGLLDNFILGLNQSSDKKIWITYNWAVRKVSLLDPVSRKIKNHSFTDLMFRQYIRDGIRNSHFFEKHELDAWYSRYRGASDGSPGPLPFFIGFDSKRRLWSVRDQHIFSPYHDEGYPYEGEVMDIAICRDILYLATNGKGLGLFDIAKRTLTYHSFRETGNSISGNALKCLLVEDNGNVWIGTNGTGLDYFDVNKKQFINYTRNDGLCDNAIFCMVKDDNGRLWLGTGNGLSCYDPSEKKFSNFSRSDGLVNSEYNRYSAVKLPDGKILMGGMDGIDCFDPDQVFSKPIAPTVQITDFRVFNKPITPISQLTLSHNQNYISIDFAALDFRNPGAINYAYKLDGIDKEWIPVGNKNSVSYATLSPGRYHFMVRASSADGTWGDTPAEIWFYIRTPWWRSAWFWGLTGLVLVSALFGVYRFRIQQIKKVYAVRTRISQDLHDEVGATLTSISYLSEVAKLHSSINQGNSNEAIDKIGEFSRDMISEMNDIVWAINPANDKFEKIESRMRNFASVLLAAKNIQLDFTTDERINHYFLGMEHRKNLYLIFKEAINNAAKYSGCSLVTVNITMQNHHILMLISDNGKGFYETCNGQGNGLENMKTRAREIGAILSIDSVPGKGTWIRFSVHITQNAY